MVWMENYCVFCSVRLGVLSISVLSCISSLIMSITVFAKGVSVFSPVLEYFNEDVYFRKLSAVKTITNKVANDSTDLNVVLQLYLFAHITASILGFYGSAKLKKYFLLPTIFSEFFRATVGLVFHILIMMVLKNSTNLGVLIAFTLAGGFVILFIGYNWASSVALYQIINLINSERYKSLYGEDPFNPLIPKTVDTTLTRSVRVLITPTNQDIDEQKKRNALRKSRAVRTQPIISVLPVNNLEANSNLLHRNNVEWKQNQWPAPTWRTPRIDQNYSTNNGYSTLKDGSMNDNYEDNYNNWQWSELAPPIALRKKNNIYLDSKWNC